MAYLAELLVAKGYEVHGIVRRVALEDPVHRLARLESIRGHVHLHVASLESFASLFQVFSEVAPDECYHLAAQSFVNHSFDDEFSTFNMNINSTHYVLAVLRQLCPKCRFYFAGSSDRARCLAKRRPFPKPSIRAFIPAPVTASARCAA